MLILFWHCPYSESHMGNDAKSSLFLTLPHPICNLLLGVLSRWTSKIWPFPQLSLLLLPHSELHWAGKGQRGDPREEASWSGNMVASIGKLYLLSFPLRFLRGLNSIVHTCAIRANKNRPKKQKEEGPGIRLLGFASDLHQQEAMWPLTFYLNSLNLSVFSCKMRITLTPTSLTPEMK